MGKKAVENIKESVFRTEEGKKLISAMYLNNHNINQN